MHSHSHSHHHHHGHEHEISDHSRAFLVGIVLNVAYVIVEGGAGFWVGSMALMADAGHNLSDVLSLLLAWGALAMSKTAPTSRRTYGFRKTTILASLTNAIVLLIAIGAIAWQAVLRFMHPSPVPGGTVVVVSGVGIVINTVTALLFMKGRHHDLNIKGAFMHMAADAGVSLGVLLAGFAIMKTGAYWIDPAISLAIVVVIAVGTWGLLRDSFLLALDAVPHGIEPAEVRRYLAGLPGVVEVHDLHIWGMSTTEVALTAHLVRPDAGIDDGFLSQVG